MRKMKNSGVEWIGEIPEEWELRRWKYVLSERKEKNDPIITNFILSLSVENGVFPYSEKTGGGNKAKEDLSAYKVARPNDIVVNSMNILAGAVGLSSWLGAVSPVYYTYYSDNDRDDINYYCYLFQSEQFQRSLLGLGNGILIKESGNGKLNTIRMRIPSEKLNRLLIPIPPISEQQKIANFLDQKITLIDEIISDSKKSIEELKAYKQSLITEIVTKGLDPSVTMVPSGIDWIGDIPEGWDYTKIKYIVQINPQYNDNFSNDDLATFLPMDRLKNGYTINDLQQEIGSLRGKYNYFANGDIVLAKVRPSFENGNIAIVSNLLNGIGFGTSEIFTIRNEKKGEFSSRYLFYYLQNSNFINIGSSTMTGVAGLKRISTQFIQNYYIPDLSFEDGEMIADFLDLKTAQIDAIITEKENLISEYESYKKSMIYEYVTGKKQVEEDEG
ncbi:Type I restriction-modification system, specificity subunit S [Streptococcus sp. DD10]|uniref:restriction endonuclease subunit S n=1 Tax=Streptococcus sp. DD10 TaxID=1777878 RepID=UPI0007931423|nr:restriction endonuclease subunit S [Streptococcus sp. DD10]KXT74058.1 Type I restriction-modification system, specificity subunit S [Streptococcus sp. DD10]